jgi:hypothetical protein
MIDKQEFYHGAAVIRILEDKRCRSIKKHDFGYLVNDNVFVFMKYSAKSRSPWGFSFSEQEITRINSVPSCVTKVEIGLICGGDGICTISFQDLEKILGGKSGRISAKRAFREQYKVSGPVATLKGKIALSLWPQSIFED